MGLTQHAGQEPAESSRPAPEAWLDSDAIRPALGGRKEEPVGSGGTGIDDNRAERPFRVPDAQA